MYDNLKIIHWPDPRLKKVSTPVTAFDADLAKLSAEMLRLMREDKGVGLAAPQVGVNLRLFVMNATGEPGDDRVYVNPVLTDGAGEEEDEEGCLSLPGIRTTLLRMTTMTLTARDVTGAAVTETATGYVARIWQHEVDHLNGTLLLDRMSPAQKLLARRKMRDLEVAWEKIRHTGPGATGRRVRAPAIPPLPGRVGGGG